MQRFFPKFGLRRHAKPAAFFHIQESFSPHKSGDDSEDSNRESDGPYQGKEQGHQPIGFLDRISNQLSEFALRRRVLQFIGGSCARLLAFLSFSSLTTLSILRNSFSATASAFPISGGRANVGEAFARDGISSIISRSAGRSPDAALFTNCLRAASNLLMVCAGRSR
jgi:hypothetical protein